MARIIDNVTNTTSGRVRKSVRDERDVPLSKSSRRNQINDSDERTSSEKRKMPPEKSNVPTQKASRSEKTPAAYSLSARHTERKSTSTSTPRDSTLSGNREPPAVVMKEASDSLECPMDGCKETFPLHSKSATLSVRLHLSEHYYAQARGQAEDQRGERGKCLVRGCTARRSMDFKELFVHMCTHHRELENIVEKNANVKVKEFMRQINPPGERRRGTGKKICQPVLQESLHSDPDHPDDPSPPQTTTSTPASATVRVPRMPAPVGVSKKPATVGVPKKPAPATAPVEVPSKPAPTPAPVEVPSKPAPAPAPVEVPSKPAPAPVPVEVPSKPTPAPAPKVDRIMTCFICNGPGRSSKEGRNLRCNSGLGELMLHFSICVYLEGGFIQYLDPWQGEARKKLQGSEEEKIDEFGRNWSYRCPFQNCEKDAGKGRSMGYKVRGETSRG